MTTCVTGCGRPTRDTLLLCRSCLWALECDLGDVGWLDEQLETVLARQIALSERNGGHSAETPLPVHPGAFKARSELRVTLVGWVRDMAESRAVEGPACSRCGHESCTAIRWHELPADTMPALAWWLLKRIDRIALHPAAADLHGEIVGAVRLAWRVVDAPANRTTFPVGPCPEVPCPGEVRAYIPAQPEREARMECTACHRCWDPTQWLRTGRRILARKGERIAYVDVQVAAASLGVTTRTIQMWVKAGKLRNCGSERRILVDLAEVEALVA